MKIKHIVALAAAVAALPIASGAAAQKSQSGTYKGLSWTATSTIVGQNSTATVAGGGNPIYLAQLPKYRGVVGLLMDYGAAGQFVCSGSLLADRKSILTAGHCVSDGTSARPNSVTAFFYDGNVTDPVVYGANAVGVTTVGIGSIRVNSLYTGEVIDDHDIAVLTLAGAAPAFATGYELYTAGDLTGVNYNVAGYGARSDTGGTVGTSPANLLGTGRLRQGDNRYDFRLGDADFDGFFDGGPEGFFGTASTTYSYLSDFDNGTAARDASCRLATSGFGLAATSKYCDLGRGATEVSTAGGDSGGPQFVDGKIASVTSYGLSFGTSFGDVDGTLNNTFGEFNGLVPVFTNLEFITGVPEPTTWALMILGFGFVGTGMRRGRKAHALTA